MAWEYSPWMVGNGVEHSVEVARLLAHAGTGGAEGVVTPGDCKVQPLNTPGTKIRVAPGAVLLKNRYPGGQQQTYVGRNTSEHEVSVTATGSGGGRSDLVVARVLDPQYEGQEPSDPNDFDYMRTEIIEDIPSSTKRFDELGLDYPAIALARIDLPASTGTVEAEHITDLRRMAQPRKERYLIAHNIDEDEQVQLTNNVGQGFPTPSSLANNGQWFIEVPEWAERVRVVATWGGVWIAKSSNMDAWGRVWINIGWPEASSNWEDLEIRSKFTSWNTDQYETGIREVWSAADDLEIPEEMKGRTVPIYPRGRVMASGSSTSLPALTEQSSVTVDVEFYETTV